MNWTIGLRLTAIGALSIAVAVTVGVIGFTEATGSASRADRAFQVGEALSTTIDSQHTASVVLADASILTGELSSARRGEVVEQMTEHADELRDQLAILQNATLENGFPALMATFGPTISAILDDAAGLTRASGALPASEFDTVLQHWNAFDESSDAVKTLLTDTSAQEVAAARSGANRTKLILLLVTTSYSA